MLTTDAEGGYRLTTVKPGSYSMRDGRIRSAHIHFDVTGRYDRLITQMYFDGEARNDADPFLPGAAQGRDMLITKLRPAPPGSELDALMAVFDIVLLRG